KVNDIQKFLGFANFYCCFIDNYSDIVIPLTRLTRKSNKWNFNDKCRNTFNTLNLPFFQLRYLLIGYPIDKLPSKPMRLIMPLGQSSQSPFPMEKYTLYHFIHAHSLNPNSIMTLTTENC